MEPQNDRNRLHFFHWPGIREHQKTLIQALALPFGAKGEFHYSRIWPNDSLIDEKDNINSNKDCVGVLWILSCGQRREGRRDREFDFACPVRLLKKVKIRPDGQRDGMVYVSYLAGEYLSVIKPFNIFELNEFTNLKLDGISKPYPCAERGYAYASNFPIEFNTSTVLETEDIFRVFEKIPSAETNGVKEPEIKTYPLIRLDNIIGVSPDEDGEFKVIIDKVYRIPYEITQSTRDRSRNIYVNSKPETDRIIKGEITKKIEEGQNYFCIEVQFNYDRVVVPIYFKPARAWHKKTWAPISLFFVLAFLAIWLYPKVISLLPNAGPDTSGNSTAAGFAALVIALMMMFLDKLFDLFKK